MFKPKKILSMIVLALIVFSFISLPAFAQARFGVRSSGGVQTNTDLFLPVGTWVYGIRIYADDSSSFMVVYNAATTYEGDGDPSLWVDEIGEATQYDSQANWFEEPIYCGSGVSVGMTTGVGYIFYGPEPTR